MRGPGSKLTVRGGWKKAKEDETEIRVRGIRKADGEARAGQVLMRDLTRSLSFDELSAPGHKRNDMPSSQAYAIQPSSSSDHPTVARAGVSYGWPLSTKLMESLQREGSTPIFFLSMTPMFHSSSSSASSAAGDSTPSPPLSPQRRDETS